METNHAHAYTIVFVCDNWFFFLALSVCILDKKKKTITLVSIKPMCQCIGSWMPISKTNRYHCRCLL